MAEFKADWEIGSLSTTTGAELSSGSVARTGFIDIQERVAFPFTGGTFGTQNCTILFYADTTYIKSTSEIADTSPYTITPPSNATKMRVTTKSTPSRNYTEADLLVLKDEFVFENSAEPPVVDEFVSAQSGVWSSASTWVGGAVPTLDKKVIVLAAHTVTLDVNVGPFASTIDVQGELSIDAGVSLTVGEKNGVLGAFHLNNGTLSGSGNLHVHRGEFKTIGDSWSYVRGAVSVGYLDTSVVQGVSWYMDKLSVVSTGTFMPHCRAGDGAGTWHLKNSVFEGLSMLQFGARASAMPTTILVDTCTITKCTDVECRGVGTVSFVNTVLHQESTSARTTITCDSGAIVTFDGTALLDFAFSGQSAQLNFDECFVMSDPRASGEYILSVNLNPNSTISNSIMYAPLGSGGGANNRTAQLYSVVDCYIETSVEGGSNGLMITYQQGDITGNIFSGVGCGITFYNETVLSANIQNNTFYMLGAYPLTSERYYPQSASNLLVKNNLVARPALQEMPFISYSNYGDTFTGVVPIIFDYNAKSANTPYWYNEELYSNSLSNSNSLENVSTGFKELRTVLSWGATKGLSNDEAVKGYMLGRNGYDNVTKTHANTPYTESIQSILAWLREGYTPTNMALATAGEGGTYVGALEPVAAPSTKKINFNGVEYTKIVFNGQPVTLG